MDWNSINNNKLDFDTITALSRKLSIFKVFEHYEIEVIEVSIDRHKAICPFHDDHDPSLKIYTENEDGSHSFCCYPCDRAGDSFEFIRGMEEEVRGRSFKDSIDILKQLTGFVGNGEGNIENIVGDILEGREVKPSEIKNMIDSLHYGLSIYYRDYLISIGSDDNYKQECKRVDKRFKEIDKFFGRKNLTYDEAERFYSEELDESKD